MIENHLAVILAGLAALVTVVNFFIQRWKDAKESGNVDKDQDIKLTELEARVKSAEITLSDLKATVEANRSEFSSLFEKMHDRLEDIYRLILEMKNRK